MAAAADSLSIEFECVVCSDQLKQPKYIGPCNHTFCKDCINKYWVSLEKGRTIPCPQCREECPIPSNGADDLKDNFTLANIIETYRKQQQRNVNNMPEVRCTLCPNRATSLCKECDLKLCGECKIRRDPKACGHDLYRLCPAHGNGLLFFCTGCKKAVCSGCRISDHNMCDHDVTPIGPVVFDLICRIRTSSSDLENAIKTQVGKQEQKLSQMRDIVQQKSTSAEDQATASAKRVLAEKMHDIRNRNAKSKKIQEQIDILLKEKENVDGGTKQLVKDVGKIEKEMAKTIADVRGRFAESSEEINQRLRSLNTRRKEMVTKIQQARAVASTNITIDNESIANLTSISQELVDLVRASREGYTVIEEVRRSIGKLGLAIGVFRQLKKVCNVTSPSQALYGLKHVHVPDSCVATLGRDSRSGDWANMIYFHDMVTSALTGTIEAVVYPARVMAVSFTGKLVLVRKEKPPIRIFIAATGAYRDIKITHYGEVIDQLRSVATDGSDNMFVLTDKFYSPLLLVVKPNGDVIDSVQLRGAAYYMAFCPRRRILCIAADDRILGFHWTNNILKEISPSAHGMKGFTCYDVCIGSSGEMLVAGQMTNYDTVIYQVTYGEDEKDLVWRKIEYQDGVKRNCCNFCPQICINGDNLWLGYIGLRTIEKFQLV